MDIKSLLKDKEKLFPLLAIVVVVLIIGASFLYNQYTQSKKLVEAQTKPTNEQAQEIVTKVGKLIVLPNEEPTLATVSDKSKLSDQPFFTNAENGDKVLIYSKAKKAILYRESTNKIIEVAPINIGQTEATTTPAVSISPIPSPTTTK